MAAVAGLAGPVSPAATGAGSVAPTVRYRLENASERLSVAIVDPYVTAGLVASWTVRQWNEVLEHG